MPFHMLFSSKEEKHIVSISDLIRYFWGMKIGLQINIWIVRILLFIGVDALFSFYNEIVTRK